MGRPPMQRLERADDSVVFFERFDGKDMWSIDDITMRAILRLAFMTGQTGLYTFEELMEGEGPMRDVKVEVR